jgi:NADH dehydrogenase (ubiquinone) Fe-S protein 5
MPLSPFWRTPFTDFGGGLINAQHYDKCGPFELDMMECLEAYGQDRGKIKCRDLIEDFHECLTMTKRNARGVVRKIY